MNFNKDEVVFLLGAGASADAGIPVSSEMVDDIEKFIDEKEDWKKFKNLYYLVKSGIEFSYGVQGKKTKFNIEILLNVLNELEKKEAHPLYSFIGSWGIRFNEVVGNDFRIIKEFRKKILDQLKTWVSPSDLKKSDYYKAFVGIKREIEFSIRIFTLNYDLLVEENLKGLDIEFGFDLESRGWNYKLFSRTEEEPDVYLYKLHGSINWLREQDTQIVKYTDDIPDEPDLIFGVQYKMQYIDPYLFLISEFRHYSLQAKLIVSIGYSFSDEHINAILHQCLLKNSNSKLFALAYGEEKENIIDILKCREEQISIVNDKTAKQFFNEDLKIEKFNELFQGVVEDGIF